jgi:hypothetical protein
MAKRRTQRPHTTAPTHRPQFTTTRIGSTMNGHNDNNESKIGNGDNQERMYHRYQSSQSGEADLMSLGSTTIGSVSNSSTISSPLRQPLRYQYRKPITPLPSSSFWDSSSKQPQQANAMSSRDRLKAATVSAPIVATTTTLNDRKLAPSHQLSQLPTTTTTTTTMTTTMTIEVAPGLSVRLRGADETWRAIQSDQYQPCTCMECNTHMFCIADAWLVLCPTCRVASPVHVVVVGSAATTTTAINHRDGGVGLGFTMDVLAEGQASLWRDF